MSDTELFEMNPGDKKAVNVDAKNITIGQYADYSVYDPEGLGGTPRILMSGREWTQEEIAEEAKTLSVAWQLFGSIIVDFKRERDGR